MRLFRVAGFMFLLVSLPLSARADEGRGERRTRPRVGDVTTFGPVALGDTQSLRLCHANHFGNQPVTVEWLFVAVPGPDPAGTPKTGVPTEVVGRLQFDLEPGTGNCAEFAPGQSGPTDASIIAVLIALLKNGTTTREIVGSAQVVSPRDPASGLPNGLLLPAVQKIRVLLPAVQ